MQRSSLVNLDDIEDRGGARSQNTILLLDEMENCQLQAFRIAAHLSLEFNPISSGSTETEITHYAHVVSTHFAVTSGQSFPSLRGGW